MSKLFNIHECEECKIMKGWGHEIIIHNSEKYCGKILVFKVGCKFSMHFHKLKQETWYINKGRFKYRWVDLGDGSLHEKYLNEGDVVTQYPGDPHQLEALTEGEVFEVSTQHFDSDSYRLWKGN